MTIDQTPEQKYAYWHKKWEQANRSVQQWSQYMDNPARPQYLSAATQRQLTNAKRRAQYANNKLCQLEALAGGLGKLTWNYTVTQHNPNTGIGAMYQDD